MQFIDFRLSPDSACRDELSGCRLSQGADHIKRESLQQSFSSHVGVKKTAAPSLKRLQHLQGTDISQLAPSLDGHPTSDRIESKHQSAGSDRIRHLLCESEIQLAFRE